MAIWYPSKELEATGSWTKEVGKETRERIFRVPTGNQAIGISYGPNIGDAYGDLEVVSKRFAPTGNGEHGILTVTYKTPEETKKPEGIGDTRVEYDTSATTENVKTALGPGPGLYGPYHWPEESDVVGNLIGVDKDGVNGVDVYRPTFTYIETHYYEDFSLADPLFEYGSSVNDRDWKGMEMGTLLFLGARVQQLKAHKWQATYHFIGRQMAVIPVPESLLPAPPGASETPPYPYPWYDAEHIQPWPWDYLWYEYEEVPDATRGIPRIKAFHVAEVYPYKNFSGIGIGS